MLLQEYSPAAEVLVQQAKAPGADGGSYINAAKHVADLYTRGFQAEPIIACQQEHHVIRSATCTIIAPSIPGGAGSKPGVLACSAVSFKGRP